MAPSTSPSLKLSRFGALFRRVTTSGSYVPQIDGLRLLAILPVLLWHISLRAARSGATATPGDQMLMNLIPHGHIGVTLFFFISGYIISYPFVTGRPPKLTQFFARRLPRIEPPYLITLLICFIPLGVFHYVPRGATSFDMSTVPLWQSLLASLVYLHGLLFQTASRLDPPAWSLEVELQFYILSPFLLFWYMKVKSFGLRATLLALLAAVCLVATRWCDIRYGVLGLQEWTILGHAYAFLTGVVASDWASRNKPFARAPLLACDAAMAVGLVGLAASGVFERAPHTLLALILDDLARIGLLILVYAGACRGRFSRRFLGLAPVALIGGMVYSIYLTHVPVVQALSGLTDKLFAPFGFLAAWIGDLVVLTPAVMIIGAVFFLAVEKPFMDPELPKRLLGLFRTADQPRPREIRSIKGRT